MKIGCRLGRHDWEYLIGDDLVVRWCPACEDPKVANAYPAKRLAGVESSDLNNDVPDLGRPDRSLLCGGFDELRTVAAMLKALTRDDHEAVWLLADSADHARLVSSLVRLLVDALIEPSTTDLAGYTDRVFARLDQP